MRVLRKKREKRKMCFHVFTFPILGERYTGWGSRGTSDTRIYKIKTPAVHSCNNLCSRWEVPLIKMETGGVYMCEYSVYINLLDKIKTPAVHSCIIHVHV
jgi:hypothetical protein